MSQNEVRVRFAPSPTGFLHVGGARTALFNWLYARHHNGKFILRVEDTDKERNTEEALGAIYDALRWIGLDWDEGPGVGGDRGPYFQSQRGDIYAGHLETLLEKDLAYDDEGAVRLRSPKKTITVNDQICGDVSVDRSQENDTALRRSNGGYIFHFVNVVDDLEMGITHVIRGEDHLQNSAKHIEIFEALGAEPPVFAHIPLILNPNGSKMSKRDAGASMADYMNKGFIAEGVRNYLCLLGWSPKDDREKMTIEEVIELFDFDHLNRSNAKFDMEKCQWLCGQYLADLDDADFCVRARKFIGDKYLTEPRLDAALTLIKPKIKLLSEVDDQLVPFFDEEFAFDEAALEKVTAKPGAAEHLGAMKSHFASIDDWEEDAIKAAIVAAAADRDVKQGAMMFPLRVATSGRNQGPDLLPSLEVLGKENVLARLDRAMMKFNETGAKA